MSPRIVLLYDSNSGPGPLGLGWSVAGLSSITRVPKTILIDNQIAPVTFTADDGLVLDGSRIVVTSSVGPNRLFSKAIDDQSRVEEIETAQGPYFISRTKAGLRLYYGAYSKDGPDGRIRTSTGKILAWPCVRIEDTFGNYIAFEYQSNGFGDWGLARARYTGNDKAGLAPYAEFEISYRTSATPLVSYLGGEEFRRTLIVDAIESRVHGKLFRHYAIEYDETQRLGLRRVRSITETGAYGEKHRPTKFDYDDPDPHWEGQSNYQLPTAFGSLISLEDGYRLVNLDSDGPAEIVYSANFIDGASGVLRPFRSTYKLQNNAWVSTPDLALPEPLATSSGADTGAFFADIDGDKLVELIVASKNGADPLAAKTYQQTGGKWVEKPTMAFPEAISSDGKRRLHLHRLTLPTGETGLLAFDTTEMDPSQRLGFWRHDGTAWVRSTVTPSQPITATELIDADLDCDADDDLLALDGKAGRVAVFSVDKDANGDLKATVTGSTDLGEPFGTQVANAAGCDHLIALTASNPRLLDLAGSSGGGLSVREISIPNIPASDIGRLVSARVDGAAGDELILRLRATPNLDTVVLGYDQTSSTWSRLPSYDRTIQDESERLSPGYLPLSVDTNGDGNTDLVLLPTAQILPAVALLNDGTTWSLVKQFVPEIAFAQRDKLGIEPQFVDLNGDSLVDVIGHFKDENGAITKAASINTASGWISANDYITPEPLTNQKTGMTGVLIDLTSDGITDFVYSFAGVHKLWKNTFEVVDGKEVARFWVEDPSFPPPPEAFSVDPYGDRGARFIDLNGDGRVDLLAARREQGGGLHSRAYINDGASWTERPEFRIGVPFVSRYPYDVQFETQGADYYRDLRGQFVDLNGDGLLDYLYRYRFNPRPGLDEPDPNRQCQNKDKVEEKDGEKVITPHPISTATACPIYSEAGRTRMERPSGAPTSTSAAEPTP